MKKQQKQLTYEEQYAIARARRPLEAACIDNFTDEQRMQMLQAMERGFARGAAARP